MSSRNGKMWTNQLKDFPSMKRMKIKPDVKTFISGGVCHIFSPSNTQEITLLDDNDEVIRTTYANDCVEVHNDGAIYAKSKFSGLYLYVEDMTIDKSGFSEAEQLAITEQLKAMQSQLDLITAMLDNLTVVQTLGSEDSFKALNK